MPIELPDLDNIDYDELVSGAIAALPGYGSDWTDYNPSDPGITVLEMLAWLIEMLVYRTNRIQPQTYAAFLDLLQGYDESALRDGTASPAADDVQVERRERSGNEPRQTMREVLQRLRQRYRAVTAADYEQLALNTFPAIHQDVDRIKRLTCWSGMDVTHVDSATGDRSPVSLDGAISLVILPLRSVDYPSSWPQPASDSELIQALSGFFEPRRLATTRVRIAGPRYVELQVAATVYIDADAHPREVLLEAHRALFDYLHPAHGGSDRQGWPFGRTVYSSDLTARLAELAGVAFVKDVRVNKGTSVKLDNDQLPKLQRDKDSITLTPMVLYGSPDQQGSSWGGWNPEVTLVSRADTT